MWLNVCSTFEIKKTEKKFTYLHYKIKINIQTGKFVINTAKSRTLGTA
jgi:hypothetical protein